MGESLILDSLEIRQFRAFRHLSIPRLQRVNLIVGKNNVGKTTLLEALLLYSSEGNLSVILEILKARDERERPTVVLRSSNGGRTPKNPIQISLLEKLFWGRKHYAECLQPIEIGGVKTSAKKLSLSFAYYEDQMNEQTGMPSNRTILKEGEQVIGQIPLLKILLGTGDLVKVVSLFPLDRNEYVLPEMKAGNCSFVLSQGLTLKDLGAYWDNTALTGLEDEVVAALQLMAPLIERVSLINDPLGVERIPIAKIRGTAEPIPLRSLGEGMNRLLGIALALVNAQNGMLLIDEVESGLHYSVQSNVWRLIFETARRLNVQVFATTHSWDCIEAFQQAAHEHPEEGLLIRLTEKKGDIVADVFDENELEIATREEVEVR